MTKFAPSDLIIGKMYRIQSKWDPARKNAKVTEDVLRFIGFGRDDELLFSGRPKIGTQTIEMHKIVELEQLPDDARCYVNHDPRKTNKPRGWVYSR